MLLKNSPMWKACKVYDAGKPETLTETYLLKNLKNGNGLSGSSENWAVPCSSDRKLVSRGPFRTTLYTFSDHFTYNTFSPLNLSPFGNGICWGEEEGIWLLLRSKCYVARAGATLYMKGLWNIESGAPISYLSGREKEVLKEWFTAGRNDNGSPNKCKRRRHCRSLTLLRTPGKALLVWWWLLEHGLDFP